MAGCCGTSSRSRAASTRTASGCRETGPGVYVYDNNPFNRVSSYRKAQRVAKAKDRGIVGRC
jgi:hypothetical protein